MDKIRVVGMEDLKMLLQWRNHPDVRNFMFTKEVIQLEDHKAWYSSISADDSKSVYVFELDGEPTGFVQFARLSTAWKVAEWGFYLAPNAPAGSGSRLAQAALRYAFNELKLDKVAGKALGFNKRSIDFHQKNGFVSEGTLRSHFFDGELYHDILCFGLLRTEWEIK